MKLNIQMFAGDDPVDVMTYDEAHYFDIGTSSSPNVVLGGVITQLDENSNPTEQEKQYITDKSKTTKVTGFSNEFPITMDLVHNEEVSDYFYEIFRDRKVGTDAQVIHYIVELWNPTGTTNVYNARKIVQTVSITGKTANPGEQISFTGSLKGGDFVDGTFNTSTKAFTESA